MIADYASDTLYSFIDRKLVPIAVQIPTVYASSIPLVIAPMLFTDSYFSFKVISMQYDSSDPMKYYYEAPQLVWNRHTGEMENWEVYDLNFSSKSPIKIPSTFMQSSDEANYGFGWCTAETLLKEYAKERLNGKLKEIAPTLKMDDNKILTICKYK